MALPGKWRFVMTRFSIATVTALGGICVSGALTPLMALETPQDGSAATYLGALAEGSNYRVAANVRGDGFMRIFIIDTNYGQFQVNGLDLTRTFIQELKALDALEKMSQSDVFAKSFQKAATAPVRYGVDLIVNPVGTVAGSLSGVANMFDRANASLAADPKANRTTTADSLLGVDDARRQLAVELGVDPYTEFPPLAKKLTEIASATAAGGLTVKAALSVIPGGAGMAISTAGSAESASDTLRNKTPAQILQEVKATLLRLNVPSGTVARFVENRAYTPADLLLISRALARLNANNTAVFIDRAAGASTRDVAFFQRRRAELLAERSRELGGITEFASVGGFPLNRTRAGTVVAAFPFDQVAWTAIMENAANAVTSELRRSGAVAPKPVLATSGAVTPTASSEFQRLGWQLVQLK